MKEQQPLISVIIPIYHVEKYLDRCVKSVMNQTWKNLEIILVDDGSVDDACPKMCDEYKKQDERMVVIHQKNGGLSAARNSGLDCCHGEFLAFVDSDDYISEKYIETMYREMTATTDIVVCNLQKVDENGIKLGDTRQIQKVVHISGREQLQNLVTRQHIYDTVVWNKLYRRKMFQRIRFPVGKIHEDVHTIHELYYQAENVAMVPDTLYYYVQRDSSIMGKSHVKNDGEVEAMQKRADFLWEKQEYYLSALTQIQTFSLWMECEGEESVRRDEKRKMQHKMRKNVSKIFFQNEVSLDEKGKLMIAYISIPMYLTLRNGKSRSNG